MKNKVNENTTSIDKTIIFINKAKLVHKNNKYDYSKSNYYHSQTKIKIKCHIHGFFEQTPNVHLSGKGCPKCGSFKLTKEDFIKKANIIHGGVKYNYNNIIYSGNKTKINIKCNTHGVFEQTPNSHLMGVGCPNCAGVVKSNTNDFITSAKIVHGVNKYNYNLVKYVNNHTNIKIICPKHGVFEQQPKNHLHGQGCSLCNESKGEIKIENYLNSKNIKFIRQYRFNNCKNIKTLPFDFYLPELNICVEYQGIQHYVPIDIWGGSESLKGIKKRDKIKFNYCKENNVNLVLIKYDEEITNKLNF